MLYPTANCTTIAYSSSAQLEACPMEATMGTRKMKAVTRRDLLQGGAGLALGSVLGTTTTHAAETPKGPGVYEALGVKPVLNATGTVTILGGSLMPPEV